MPAFEEAWLYDDDWVLGVDARDLEVLRADVVKCPFCTARFARAKDNSICDVCTIAKIGAEVLGFKK
jgi:hypothetical protein